MVLVLFTPYLVHATTFTVTKTGDTADGACDSDCSLREAIIAANASVGADIIVFDTSLTPGTFTLSKAGTEENQAETGDLDITDNLTITGEGAADTIIDGNQLDRVLHVINSNVTIEALSIKNGRFETGWPSGAGILIDIGSTLNIENCIISDNHSNTVGGGIHNFRGSLTLANSTISSNRADMDGGGIHVSGSEATLIIEKSSIFNNECGVEGGGIWTAGNSSIRNSTIALNAATFGGGIYNSGVQIIKSSTIAHNSTFGGQGGGIFSQSMSDLQNTILAENIASGGGSECFGTLKSLGNNIFGDIVGDNFCTIIDFNNQTDLRDVESGLGCFADDGTAGNWHIPLLPDSPAIDKGNDIQCTGTDQRGQTRINICDIGSIELYDKIQYRFIVMADSRGSSATHPINELIFSSILKSIRSFVDCKPKFILFSGDLILGRSDRNTVETQLNAWKDIIDDVMGLNYSKRRVFPAFGGHERIANTTTFPDVYAAFSTVFDPVNESFIGMSTSEYLDQSQYGNTVYYFDYANSRVFVLNNDLDPKSNTNDCVDKYGNKVEGCGKGHEIGKYQRDWIAGKIDKDRDGQPDKFFNFFVHHEPSYGVNAHDTRANKSLLTMDAKPSQRDAYLDVIRQNDAATLLFAGHEHQYMRMNIDKNKGVYELKTGTCGAPIYRKDGGLNPGDRRGIPSPSFNYHFAVVDVDDQSIEFKVYSLPTVEDLPDNGTTPRTISINKDGIHNIIFSVDNIVGTLTGLSEIEIIDENGINITSAAEVIECSSELNGYPCSNAYDRTTNTNWKTDFYLLGNNNRKKPTWIKLFFYPARNIREIKLYDITDSNEYVKNGTLIIEDVAGIAKLGTIEGNTATLSEGIPVDNIFHDYLTHTGVAPRYKDVDQDGALNTEEGKEDIDGDSILDYRDQDTANIILAQGNGRVAIDLPENQFQQIALNSVDSIIETDSTIDQQTKPQDKYFPFDIIEMNITGVPEGGLVTVDLIYSFHIPVYSNYYTVGSWNTIPIGSHDGDGHITITLTDGGNGDLDSQTNGKIKHRGGIGSPLPENMNEFVNFYVVKQYGFTDDICECFDPGPETEPNSFIGTFSFDARLENKSNHLLHNLMVQVDTLTNGNELQYMERDPGTKSAILKVPKNGHYADGKLGGEEFVDVHFVICLRERKPFQLLVDVRANLEAASNGGGDVEPIELLSATVVIDGCGSGVANHLLDSGHTISDCIEDCASDANNHGNFVSCVAKLSNDLKKAGIITGEEKGAIQSCAAQADIP